MATCWERAVLLVYRLWCVLLDAVLFSHLVSWAGCGIWLYWFLIIALFKIWAATWQNQQNECAPSEDSDQPGHPTSLIRVFAVRMKKPWIISYPMSTERRFWSDWADAQADLSLRWAHTHFVGFVLSWLIYFAYNYVEKSLYMFKYKVNKPFFVDLSVTCFSLMMLVWPDHWPYSSSASTTLTVCKHIIIDPCHEKTCLKGFQPVKTPTRLRIHRD